MTSSLTKKRNDKGSWIKAEHLREGLEIAVPDENGNISWGKIASVKPVGKEPVYDIEIEGTHNFVGNDIFAHNTRVIRSGNLSAKAPEEILTADGSGADISKLATYTLSEEQKLADKVNAGEVKVVSLEARVEALESGAISSGSSSPISLSTSTLANALSSFGVLIRDGIAQFQTLVFRQLVASKDADGTSSAGSVSIPSGSTIALVENSMVKPSTKVFVTFNSQVAGSWWVSDKVAGSFRVVLSGVQSADVTFDYFLVQTEGQLSVGGSQTSSNSGSLTSSTDRTAPVITLLGDNPIRLAVGDTFSDPGITATDDVDGALPSSAIMTYVNGVEASTTSAVDTSVAKTYIITYRATDAAGNIATVTRSVIVGDGSDGGSQTSSNSGNLTSAPSDATAPVVALNGDAAMQITAGDTFTDPGATATDSVDGDLTTGVTVTGAVDNATPGLYTLTYSATDTAGNTGSVSRVVTVVAAPSP